MSDATTPPAGDGTRDASAIILRVGSTMIVAVLIGTLRPEQLEPGSEAEAKRALALGRILIERARLSR